jgi:hypothetical protein
MKKVGKNTIIYITRDIERAIGCLTIPSIFIISNETPFAKSVQNAYPNRIHLIDSLNTLDTHELLVHEKTEKFLETLDSPKILVFKNTSLIEKWCGEKGYTLLNPASKLASSLEEKITQLTTLEKLRELMPRYEKKRIEEIQWLDTPFVLQFNHSHTGSGTMIVETAEQLNELKNQFPKRESRIATVIEGPVFTSNIIVAHDTTLTGNISYQITGIKPFTDSAFATIGNDWGAPYRILNESERTSYDLMAREVADTLRNLGWVGLFGIDAIWSTKESRWYLIEINARQPASASYESELQNKIKKDEDTLTILEAHVKALLDEPLNEATLVKISNGAQIIQRITKKIDSLQKLENKIEELEKNNLKVITYENTEHNSDLLRIQSTTSIIEIDNEFTDTGKQIENILF